MGEPARNSEKMAFRTICVKLHADQKKNTDHIMGSLFCLSVHAPYFSS